MERRSTGHDNISLSSLIAIYCHDVSKMFIWKSSTITCPGSHLGAAILMLSIFQIHQEHVRWDHPQETNDQHNVENR